MKEGFNEGSMVGEIDGIFVVGTVLGESVGYDDGVLELIIDGKIVGLLDGTNDGFPLGELLG